MKRVIAIVFALCAVCFGRPAYSKVTLPSVIGSNMVLQRNGQAQLWGWSDKKEVTVKASWLKKSIHATVDRTGRWKTSIPTCEAGGPYTIEFNDGASLKIDNILMGEVWICSGQSNMQMPVQGFDSQPCNKTLPTLLKAGAYPRVRLFQVARTTAYTPQENCKGTWQVSSLSSAADFSAAAYYFGINLYDALQIPIGLIESDWGGTRIEAWMSEQAAQSVDPNILASNPAQNNTNQVATLYNGMIQPIAPFSARGFIWYQGESNKGMHKKYPRDMAAMVNCWRNLWNNNEMAFYYVQIAPFDYDIPMHRFEGRICPILCPLLVEAQIKALDLIPHSGMVVNTDLGDAIAIHPPYKDIVGQRIALMALDKTYGQKGIESCGPMFKNVVFEAGKAIVEFDTKSTLMPIDTPLKGFEIAGQDRKFYPADALVIHHDYDFTRKVSVSSSRVADPIAVRYAFRNVVEVNLTNTAGLPAYPFRTDDWDTVY